jgi:hypothetical protein
MTVRNVEVIPDKVLGAAWGPQKERWPQRSTSLLSSGFGAQAFSLLFVGRLANTSTVQASVIPFEPSSSGWVARVRLCPRYGEGQIC